MRFKSERTIRHWFEKKSGGKSDMFKYNADISSYKRIVVFLPVEQYKFFALLPLAVVLFEKLGSDNFLVVTDERNRHILRALNLEFASLFYKKETMLYGSPDFFEMEKRLQEQRWSLCLFLHEKAELPYLYLARITRAKYRMGMSQEFPFLNITLQSSYSNNSIYASRNFLYKSFKIDLEKAESDSIRATQKNERYSNGYKLSTSSTLLLNLEPPIEGEPWSEFEISMIYKAFQPTWRLIAITAYPKQFEQYYKIMEELDMRSNPVLLHSESIFSVLRQYPAIITLNSMHSHMFLNLSLIKVLMLEQINDVEFPNNNRLLKFGREGNFYSLSKLATDFIK